MEISCAGCGKKYRIDNSKLPVSGRAAITCPGCGYRIEIDVSAAGEHGPGAGSMDLTSNNSGTGDAASAGGSKVSGTASHGYRGRDEEDEAGLEFFEPGTRTALVFCPDYEAMTQIEKGLKKLEYEIRSVSSAREVQVRFRYHIYDLLILYQSGPEPENRLREIIQWINNMNMEIRRRILVFHISMSGNRFDTMQAFSMGVDTTISPLDIAVLPDILKKIQSSKQADYAVFNECLVRVKEEVF